MPKFTENFWGPVRHAIHLEVLNCDSASIKHAPVFTTGPNCKTDQATQPPDSAQYTASYEANSAQPDRNPHAMYDTLRLCSQKITTERSFQQGKIQSTSHD